jgi:hypothetical protein
VVKEMKKLRERGLKAKDDKMKGAKEMRTTP